ncbi:MAG: hypothetical protein M1832_004005 [Thelocarpon impressellum]|nr:MAG: hypothetical protein M1832_004005 [Thelocarpon impressellum]
MASSRSPLPQMPFGYSFEPSFDAASSFPYPSPPTPAPGPSLLDDSESHMLGDFFDRVSSATFDNGEYFFDKAAPSHGLSELQFGWADALPPTLHATSTSLSHPAMAANGVHELQRHGDARNGHYVSPLYRPASTADDVLAAAALLQNGHAQLVHSIDSPETPVFPHRQSMHEFGTPAPLDPPLRRQSSQQAYPTHTAPAQRPSSNSSHPRANSVDVSEATFYPSMLYGAPRRTNSGPPAGVEHQSKAVEVRWGSDVSFLEHGYVAPPEQETEEEVTTELMHKMKSFLPPASAASTRPPSPKTAARRRPHQHRSQPAAARDAARLDSDEASDEQDDGRANGRKKRKVKEDDGREDDDGSESAGQVKPRKRLAASARAGRPPRPDAAADDDAHRDRSQSASAGQKPNRENLSEEQKRSNHILSEQKRRNLIKQGFDDLCELVPDLKGGGYSKSAMLVQAADWLEDVLKGNAELKALVARLDGRRA